MYPNLDEKIGYLRDKSLKELDLDVISDNEHKFSDLYQDYLEKRNKFSANNTVAFTSVPTVDRKKEILDIQPLLLADDKDFVQACYRRLLKCDAKAEIVTSVNEELKAKNLTRVEYIKSITDTYEFKKRDVILTGFPKMSLNTFMSYKGREFVDFAYLGILKRYPDNDACRNYLRLLYNGDISEVEILHDLLASPEAANRNLAIEGLEETYQKELKSKKIYSVPLIGKVARFANKTRKLNASLNALSDRVIELEEDNATYKEVNNSLINELQTSVVMISEELKILQKFSDQFSNTSIENNRVITEKLNEISNSIAPVKNKNGEE